MILKYGIFQIQLIKYLNKFLLHLHILIKYIELIIAVMKDKLLLGLKMKNFFITTQ